MYQKTTRNSYLESNDGPARPASNIDRFERCFSIFKLAKEEKRGATQPETLTENGVQILQTKPARHKPWRAVRVDLVVSPISQFAFALLGWTGSKVTFHKLPRIGCSIVNDASTDSIFSAVV